MALPTYLSGALYKKSQMILRDTVAGELERYELTPTSWSFLGSIAHAPNGIKASEIASGLGMKQPLATIIVQDLVRKELITQQTHSRDKRAKLLLPTKEGQKIAKLIEHNLEAKLGALLQGITDEELETYRKVLETIIQNGLTQGDNRA